MKPLDQLREKHIRSRNSGRLAAVREKTMREVPGGAMASDQFCRQHDLTIDFCENAPDLEFYVIDYITRMMEDANLTARICPIHIDGRFADTAKVCRPAVAFSQFHRVPAWCNCVGFVELTQHFSEP